MRDEQPRDRAIIDPFIDLYWNDLAPWTNVFWRGQQVAKCPLDLWIYQEILFATKPEVLIETGSCIGGSAYFFATIMDLIGTGKVVTVDKDAYPNQPQHPRIEYLVGDSLSWPIEAAMHVAALGWRTMVVLDSLHTYDHVRAELEIYSKLVTRGCYLVVEDTGLDPDAPWALRAVNEFVAAHPDFTVDRSCERHLMTLNPGGWLRRS